jgi:hypothetical protein
MASDIVLGIHIMGQGDSQVFYAPSAQVAEAFKMDHATLIDLIRSSIIAGLISMDKFSVDRADKVNGKILKCLITAEGISALSSWLPGTKDVAREMLEAFDTCKKDLLAGCAPIVDYDTLYPSQPSLN